MIYTVDDRYVHNLLRQTSAVVQLLRRQAKRPQRVPVPTHSTSTDTCGHTMDLVPDLEGSYGLLDERERLVAVLVDVLLVGILVVALAAVRVGLVAVRLDDGRVGGRALEAGVPGGELWRGQLPGSVHDKQDKGHLHHHQLCRSRRCTTSPARCAGRP